MTDLTIRWNGGAQIKWTDVSTQGFECRAVDVILPIIDRSVGTKIYVIIAGFYVSYDLRCLLKHPALYAQMGQKPI